VHTSSLGTFWLFAEFAIVPHTDLFTVIPFRLFFTRAIESLSCYDILIKPRHPAIDIFKDAIACRTKTEATDVAC